MIKSPNQQYSQSVTQIQKWTQSNDSDIDSTIYASKNIDLNQNKGKARVGDRMILTTCDTAGFGNGTVASSDFPLAFKSLPGTQGGRTTMFAVGGGKLLVNTNGIPANPFDVITPSSGSLPPNLNQSATDMEYFNGYLYITGDTGVITKVTGTAPSSLAFTTITKHLQEMLKDNDDPNSLVFYLNKANETLTKRIKEKKIRITDLI
jgi:hypothetical protein